MMSGPHISSFLRNGRDEKESQGHSQARYQICGAIMSNQEAYSDYSICHAHGQFIGLGMFGGSTFVLPFDLLH